ncbi:hypothetical protein So717_05840 [Roseobacter cerasinus]|uniref:Lipoprotein n=1 Tax=Roseobacter cerasinus TaxID=2602289 RepID=A0A640VP15_9RHOB|nr:hypothetical protein [Roseobacter cerasinus]GFE48831.1 hypothetical protein So717_05840 [Roseobacter cerasinus]
MRGLPATLCVAMLLTLSACTAQGVSSDTAELRNMWRSNLVPKSTPYQMVRTFDRVCTNGPRDDATLRSAGYVPLTERAPGARAYVIDNRYPAVAVSDRMCLVLAESRTGQTANFNDYVAKTFPRARAIDPKPLGRDIEQAWQVPTTPPAIIATERTVSVGWYRYALILFQPEAG